MGKNKITSNHFMALGPKLFDLGYDVFPTTPGDKTPLMQTGETWKVDITKEMVEGWASNGKGIGGVAISNVAGIDVDVKDKELSLEVVRAIKEILPDDVFGFRVGQSPKAMFMGSARSDIPVKIKNTWYFPDGRKEEIELLPPGKTHYWIAYGTHPCGRQYVWFGLEPTDIRAEDLYDFDEIDLAQIMDAFDAACERRGLVREKPGGSAAAEKTVKVDVSDDPFSNLKLPLGIDLDELKAHVNNLPAEYCDDRDQWIRVGMAIHHETEGSEDGFEIFDAWSQQSAKYDGEKDTRGRWNSFKTKTTGDAVTIRGIIKASGMGIGASKEDIDAQEEAVETHAERVEKAEDATGLREAMLEARKDKTLDKLAVSELAGLIKQRAKVLGIIWSVADIRGEIRPKGRGAGLPVGKNAPGWTKGWVYLMNQDKFTLFGEPVAYTRSAFRGKYGREMELLSNEDEGTLDADRYVLDKVKVPVVHDHMYFPGAIGKTFTFQGQEYANTYSPESHGDRKPRAQWTPEDKAAVAFYEAHVKDMFDKDGEADVVLDTICYIAQSCVTQRVEWLLIIKGCEGDGKTAMLTALAHCLGSVNTGIVNAEEIVDSKFTEWAHGGLFKILEELKVPSSNRFAVINKIKSYITNRDVSIHPKGRRAFLAINTTSYIATTNYFDCIPIMEDSRRYGIVESRFNSKQQVLEEKGSDYFVRLFDAIECHSEAISEWMMTRKISADFSPHNAPNTPSRDEAMMMATSDDIETIKDIISSDEYRDITCNIIDTKALSTALEMHHGVILEGRTMGKLLGDLGYRRIPWQVKIAGDVKRFWVKGLKITKDRGKMNEEIREILCRPFG